MNNPPSILLNDVDTWADWGLIPSSRLSFSPPQLKSKYIDIPGEDGALDLSDTYGSIQFADRTGTLNFFISDESPPIAELYGLMITHLHGRIVRATILSDPDWFYDGRFTVRDIASAASYGQVSIDYVCSVFKQERLYQTEDWLWDPFDFESGEIGDHENLLVQGQLDISIGGEPRAVPFTFTATSQMIVRFNGIEYQIPIGTTEIKEIKRDNPPVNLSIYGNGRITIDYRGRSM